MKQGLWFALVLAAVRVFADECDDIAPRPAPVEVTYRPDERTSFTAEADGTVRAVDAASGLELWHFAPPGLDPTHRAEGLVSAVRVVRFDADRVWLYFGMRRGGRSYYALDASDRTRVAVLWSRGPVDLPGVGETWSTPTIAKVRVGSVERFVVIVGGGFSGDANVAHRLFMLDAATGARLWFAGGPGGEGTPNLPLPRMTHAIPARIAVLDTDGDDFADRLYLADLGGQLWRFDIANGNEPDALVAGGVLANVGARRFFQPPDVALVSDAPGAYFTLAIGSGDRSAPLSAEGQDRFYSIRDRRPFGRMTQAEYDAQVPILEGDLVDVSLQVPYAAAGWKIDLSPGEKVLNEATTVNGTILFTTFTPNSTCAAEGTNRVYALQLESGKPALDFDGDQVITNADASWRLSQGGIAGELRIDLPPPPDTATDPSAPTRRTNCWIGNELLPVCVFVPRLRRTFWHRAGRQSRAFADRKRSQVRKSAAGDFFQSTR